MALLKLKTTPHLLYNNETGILQSWNGQAQAQFQAGLTADEVDELLTAPPIETNFDRVPGLSYQEMPGDVKG